MDALHRSILNIWWQWEQNWGEDSARPIDERTSFNIASAFALENGTLQQGAIQTLSENELTARLPRDDAGNLNQAHLSGTDEWYEHLVHQKLLSAKPPNTTATLNVIYVHRDYCPHRGMASSTLLDIFTLFGLDTSFFRLISIQGETWHFVRRDDGTCTFLVIISSLYSLAYNVSLIGRQTNCVIFGRSFKNINRALDVTHFNFYQPAWFDNDVAFNAGRAFPLLLKSIQPYALHHPLSLAYLCLLDIMSSTFVEVSDEYATINALERATNADAVAQERLDLWVSLSQGAGRTNTQLAKISNTIEVASLLLKTLEDRKGWEKWCRRFVATADYQTGLHRRATKWLAEGLPSCRLLLEHEKTQLRLQDNRVRALTPIVSLLPFEITYIL